MSRLSFRKGRAGKPWPERSRLHVLLASVALLILGIMWVQRKLLVDDEQDAALLRLADGPESALTHHHLLSIKPLTHSLHTKWKLWSEMNNEQRKAALKEVGSYMNKYGKLIMSKGERGKIKHGDCVLKKFKNGHSLCGPPPEGACNFISFGINDDPSFDVSLAEEWGCRGFAGDPTVHHPSKLHPKVTFHNVGASLISDNEERVIDKCGTEDW